MFQRLFILSFYKVGFVYPDKKLLSNESESFQDGVSKDGLDKCLLWMLKKFTGKETRWPH